MKSLCNPHSMILAKKKKREISILHLIARPLDIMSEFRVSESWQDLMHPKTILYDRIQAYNQICGFTLMHECGNHSCSKTSHILHSCYASKNFIMSDEEEYHALSYWDNYFDPQCGS